jgi:hypothetical protein
MKKIMARLKGMYRWIMFQARRKQIDETLTLVETPNILTKSQMAR